MSQAGAEQGSTGSAVPTKCAACEALQQVPFACEDCNHLLSHVQGADYFELFGLPQRYDLDIDELEAKYLAISRNIHPDKFAMAGDEMQAFALRGLAAVNRAYDVLRDPTHRAEYMLESAGGHSAAEDRQVPEALLAEIMALREEIEEAKAGGDGEAVESIRDQVLRQKQVIGSEISRLCRDLATVSEESKQTLRLQLNAMKYVNNLLGHLEAPGWPRTRSGP
jgi:molecular chaperone HscB